MQSPTRRAFLKSAAAAFAACTATAAPRRPPNILFICTDDQAPWALRHGGNAAAHTPNIDALCATGTYFPNMFVTTPVCSPSRASTMTSRYGSEVGITDWIDPRKEPELGLAETFTTWPSLLADAGYQTALIGKWHLGTQDAFHPTKRGFQHFTGFRAGGTKPVDPELEVNGELKVHTGVTDEILNQYAIDQLNAFDTSKPFLLNVHYRWPHSPWQPLPEEDWALYRDANPPIPNPEFPNLDVERATKMMKEYLAACAGVDRLVGDLLRALDETGRADDTIVIFTSDNGYNMGHNGMWHKGNGHLLTRDVAGIPGNDPRVARPNLYDNSLRVPTAIRWPGVSAPGSRVDETISILDWLPTILSMANIDMPRGLVHRGRDFTPLFRGKGRRWNNDLYAEYSQHHYTIADLRMYRTPEWKLIRDFARDEKDELYDLVNDPAESRNLIDEPAAQTIRKQLDAKLLARMKTLTGARSSREGGRPRSLPKDSPG